MPAWVGAESSFNFLIRSDRDVRGEEDGHAQACSVSVEALESCISPQKEARGGGTVSLGVVGGVITGAKLDWDLP